MLNPLEPNMLKLAENVLPPLAILALNAVCLADDEALALGVFDANELGAENAFPLKAVGEAEFWAMACPK